MTSPVVTPTPNPNPDTNIVSGAWEGIKGAPRWVYVAIIGGGIAIWYGFHKVKPAGTSVAKEGQAALDGTVTTDGSTTPVSDQSGDQTAYWYVDVAPAGWASTLNGIALQFHGNTNRINEIQQANPAITQKPYEKLPTGLKVKVPR